MRACRRVSAEPTEHTGEAGGWGCRWLEAPAGGTPVVYVHGVPNTAALWRPFLRRTGGLAPDLPGFGAVGQAGGVRLLDRRAVRLAARFLAERGVERYSLVAHDWGAAALALAQAEPERIERLVLLDAVPLLPGYEWHTLARQWRRPLVGEMAMGFTFKFVTRRLLRLPDGSAFPEHELDDIWDHFDHGTQRAILRLYRSAPPRALEAAGAQLEPDHVPRAGGLGRRRRVPADELRPRLRGGARRPGRGRDRGGRRPLALDRPRRRGRPGGTIPGVSDLWDKLERAYHAGIEAPGKETHLLILLALVITFGIVRLITHAIRNQSRWWPGHDVETKSGLHIHHMVPGILLLMFSGYLGLSLEPGTPWRELLAVVVRRRAGPDAGRVRAVAEPRGRVLAAAGPRVGGRRDRGGVAAGDHVHRPAVLGRRVRGAS